MVIHGVELFVGNTVFDLASEILHNVVAARDDIGHHGRSGGSGDCVAKQEEEYRQGEQRDVLECEQLHCLRLNVRSTGKRVNRKR